MVDNNRRGFTLVELICVLCVLGIMSMITYPNINKIVEGLRLKTSTRILVSDLRYAKMFCTQKNVPSVFVRFNGDTSIGVYTGYTIYYFNAVSGSVTLKKVELPENTLVDGTESTFSRQSSENRIEFRSDGSVNPACTIVLKDNYNNKKRYITLTIGYTRIMEVIK